MKKVLLFLLLVGFSFTLSACDTDVIDSIADLDTSIVTITTDITSAEALITTLEDAVDLTEADIVAAETLITNLEDAVDDAEADIADIVIDTEDIQVQIDALDVAITLLNDKVEMLEEKVAALWVTYDLVDSWRKITTTEIVFMFNNDVHGRVNDDSYSGSMGYATIKNIIDEVRANYDNTYLIAAGDMFHGTTFATLENGESVVEVMNAVGYDLMVPGNHDFDYGQDQLLVLEGLADFKLISSNIQYDVDDTDMFDPYYIEEFGDVKVGFFGITTPDTTYMTHPDNVIGLNFLDPIAQATMYVAELEEMEADVIVMLAHVGLDTSSSITTAEIIQAVDGIDIVIDGHSHSYLPQGTMVNDTVIVSTGEYNKNLGILAFTVEDDKIIEFNGILINADEAAVLDLGIDQDIQDIIDAIEVDQEVILSVLVGQTAVELDGVRDNVRSGETNLGNLIADSMIDVTSADIAITNGGGIRESIAAGDVTVGDIITVLPFGNIIVTVDLTGQEIIDTLEFATSAYPETDGGFPHVSGITFDINLNNAEGSRVENVMINSVAINVSTVYSVATNDFLAAGGDDFTILGDAVITGEYMGLHEALQSMFTVGVDVTIPTPGRITVIEIID